MDVFIVMLILSLVLWRFYVVHIDPPRGPDRED